MRNARAALFGFCLAWFLVAACLAADQKADAVLINKSEKSLYLLTNDRVIAEYSVVFGSSPRGHKVQEGDERTPEGKYVLDYKNPHSKYFKSIHVSYPNSQDRKRARELGVSPGGDIMIHGQPNDLGWTRMFSQFVNWTDGCIALDDADMQEVWDAVDTGTPIEIIP
jgi:murein L,D-transpeptidase YafK